MGQGQVVCWKRDDTKCERPLAKSLDTLRSRPPWSRQKTAHLFVVVGADHGWLIKDRGVENALRRTLRATYFR